MSDEPITRADQLMAFENIRDAIADTRRIAKACSLLGLGNAEWILNDAANVVEDSAKTIADFENQELREQAQSAWNAVGDTLSAFVQPQGDGG